MSSACGKFDYIIAGAGCAGLSLASRIVSNKSLSSKSILIIDRDVRQHNDRTWCYWENGAGFFESIVHKSWEYLYFHGLSSRSVDRMRMGAF